MRTNSLSTFCGYVKSDTLKAVKPAEDGNGIIIRLCERGNIRSQAKLTFAKKLRSAAVCDLMENEEEVLQTGEDSVECLFYPFEIKTLRINFV